MVGTWPPRCLQARPHGTTNAATEGPGYRATPRSTTEPHRGWMSDTYLLHLHAEGEKCFLLTSPFIEPAKRCSLAPMITSQSMAATSRIMTGCAYVKTLYYCCGDSKQVKL